MAQHTEVTWLEESTKTAHLLTSTYITNSAKTKGAAFKNPDSQASMLS